MSGIVFFATEKLGEIVSFYTHRLGMTVWIQQEDCTILKSGDLAIGFCQRDRADTNGIITFVCGTKKDVEERFSLLNDLAEGPPRMNERYRIFHFFLRDPEGRRLEVQKFLDL